MGLSDLYGLSRGDAGSARTSAQPAGENRSVAIPFCAQKHQRWYGALMGIARNRSIDNPYTEIHHVIPRSMGGSDEPSNLVELTYREHFIAHWLLTKISRGADLRKMQKALFAMTLKANGTRIVSAWQFEVAKRAVKDLKISTGLLLAAKRGEEEARKREMEQHSAAWDAKRKELDAISKTFLEDHKDLTPPAVRRRSRKQRPSKRARMAAQAA